MLKNISLKNAMKKCVKNISVKNAMKKCVKNAMKKCVKKCNKFVLKMFKIMCLYSVIFFYMACQNKRRQSDYNKGECDRCIRDCNTMGYPATKPTVDRTYYGNTNNAAPYC